MAKESTRRVSPMTSNVIKLSEEFLIYPLYSVAYFVHPIEMIDKMIVDKRTDNNFIWLCFLMFYLNPSFTPSPNKEKSYFTGSSGQSDFNFLVISSTAFQSFCFFKSPNDLPTLLV